jgi:beta-mannosidase
MPLDLSGTWKHRWTDDQRGRMEYTNANEIDPVRYLDAQVPGEIHLDLWRQGLITDPYIGPNCLSAH